ncbi:MAG: hypothetical protein FJW88_05045 [Actinobacteria bacterium]|nr:hypothetical protein [Actinomycetota bacterium]
MATGQRGIFAQGTRACEHLELDLRRGAGADVALDGAGAVVAALASETQCFLYHDGGDLTGFVDGTENPPVEEGPEVAPVPHRVRGEGGGG